MVAANRSKMREERIMLAELHARLDQRQIYRARYALLIVTALKLLWDGVLCLELGHCSTHSACLKGVESRTGAVAWGRWPTLRFPSPLIGRVEDWRAGRSLDRATF